MSDNDTMPVQDLDDDWAAEDEPLPRRPRRRLVTPVSATLAGALVGALGFIGGVEVQKGQGNGGSATNASATALTGAGGGGRGAGLLRGAGPQAAGPGGGQSNATVGSVANKKGSTLYVKSSDGNLVRVKTTSHSKINRTAKTTASAIHPGDTVIVQGTTSKDGTVTATQVNATSSSATSGLSGLFGGGGRAGQGPGAGALQPRGGG